MDTLAMEEYMFIYNMQHEEEEEEGDEGQAREAKRTEAAGQMGESCWTGGYGGGGE